MLCVFSLTLGEHVPDKRSAKSLSQLINEPHSGDSLSSPIDGKLFVIACSRLLDLSSSFFFLASLA